MRGDAMDQGHGQVWSPEATRDPVEDAAESYLQVADGNPSAALRMAVADVVTLNHLAVLVGEGASWGFLRRRRDDMLGGVL